MRPLRAIALIFLIMAVTVPTGSAKPLGKIRYGNHIRVTPIGLVITGYNGLLVFNDANDYAAFSKPGAYIYDAYYYEGRLYVGLAEPEGSGLYEYKVYVLDRALKPREVIDTGLVVPRIDRGFFTFVERDGLYAVVNEGHITLYDVENRGVLRSYPDRVRRISDAEALGDILIVGACMEAANYPRKLFTFELKSGELVDSVVGGNLYEFGSISLAGPKAYVPYPSKNEVFVVSASGAISSFSARADGYYDGLYRTSGNYYSDAVYNGSEKLFQTGFHVTDLAVRKGYVVVVGYDQNKNGHALFYDGSDLSELRSFYPGSFFIRSVYAPEDVLVNRTFLVNVFTVGNPDSVRIEYELVPGVTARSEAEYVNGHRAAKAFLAKPGKYEIIVHAAGPIEKKASIAVEAHAAVYVADLSVSGEFREDLVNVTITLSGNASLYAMIDGKREFLGKHPGVYRVFAALNAGPHELAIFSDSGLLKTIYREAPARIEGGRIYSNATVYVDGSRVESGSALGDRSSIYVVRVPEQVPENAVEESVENRGPRNGILIALLAIVAILAALVYLLRGRVFSRSSGRSS